MVSIPTPGHPVRGSTTGRPIMALFDLVGRRWALRVVWELLDGDATFRGLAHRCDDVSSSVLRDRLRDLTAAGIVERGDGGYRLTVDGRELVELLRPLGQWSQRWAAREHSVENGHARSSSEEVH
ncbi:helix-turn-helix domain-containing protein [Nakamurella sp. A5-74]|uniref:Helix-turn-helix domain-containing protein n=1 Tax=Nakamurella sp. A5-74 TaxID=3158264 RepID=A0AAU8DJN9_9ACTN